MLGNKNSKMKKVTLKGRLVGVIKDLGYFLFGFLFLPSFLLVGIVSLPVLVYRLVLCTIIAPFYRPEVAKPVTIRAQGMATEFLEKAYEAPRGTIVTTTVFDGTFSRTEIFDLVERKWIFGKDLSTGELKYPEMRQYMTQWMGYMFWKQDNSFDLRNHVFFHEVGSEASPEESKDFVNDLIETLINKSYTRGRSPWDFHVVYNFNDPELCKRSKQKEMIGLILRMHHSMADGFSIMSLLCEGLFDLDLTACGVARPLKLEQRRGTIVECLAGAWNAIQLPFKFTHNVGRLVCPLILKKSPWHLPDEKKSWKQLYVRSPLIPIQKLKTVKNALGVSFTAVVLSSVSAGLTHSLKLREKKTSCKSVPFATAIPLKGHPNKLSVHFTGTVVDLSTDESMDPFDRLHFTEASLRDAAGSLLPFVIVPFMQALACIHVAPLAHYLFWNRLVTTGITNFPGMGKSVQFLGRNCLTTHFAVGALEGVAGIGFMALSHDDHIQFVCTAEAALMDKAKLNEMMGEISAEIERLYELSLEHDDDKK